MAFSQNAIVFAFRTAVRSAGLYEGLRVLNRTVDFRFTGVYRFVDDVVMSVVLFDRENPSLVIGEDVRLRESYCVMTAELGDRCTIENSFADHRLVHHAAREAVLSYCAVLLKQPDGSPLGTLCHFDIKPRPITEEIFELLEAVRGDVECAVMQATGLPARNPTPRIADFRSRRAPAGD